MRQLHKFRRSRRATGRQSNVDLLEHTDSVSVSAVWTANPSTAVDINLTALPLVIRRQRCRRQLTENTLARRPLVVEVCRVPPRRRLRQLA